MNQRLTRKEIKRDQVQETLAEIMEFLRENLRTLLMLGGLVLLAVGVAAAYWSYRDTRRKSPMHRLRRTRVLPPTQIR